MVWEWLFYVYLFNPLTAVFCGNKANLDLKTLICSAPGRRPSSNMRNSEELLVLVFPDSVTFDTTLENINIVFVRISISALLHILCDRDTKANLHCPRKKATKIKRPGIFTNSFLWTSKSVRGSFVLFSMLWTNTDRLLSSGTDQCGHNTLCLSGCIAVVGCSSACTSWCFSVL